MQGLESERCFSFLAGVVISTFASCAAPQQLVLAQACGVWRLCLGLDLPHLAVEERQLWVALQQASSVEAAISFQISPSALFGSLRRGPWSGSTLSGSCGSACTGPRLPARRRRHPCTACKRISVEAWVCQTGVGFGQETITHYILPVGLHSLPDGVLDQRSINVPLKLGESGENDAGRWRCHFELGVVWLAVVEEESERVFVPLFAFST